VDSQHPYVSHLRKKEIIYFLAENCAIEAFTSAIMLAGKI
jgi:hypothetical protein